MKMTKKLITITAILALVMTVGLVGTARAAGDDVVFSSETTIDIQDLVISANSQVEGIEVGASTVTVSMAVGSDITFTSASGKEMTLSPAAAGTVTYLAGGASTAAITYNAAYPEVILTVTSTLYSNLTEINVYANPLTANTLSSYTVTFKTVTELVATDKIQLDFGTGFTITDDETATNVTTLTDDRTDIKVGISLDSQAGGDNIITIALNSTVAAESVINLVLHSSLVKNPAASSADTAVSGIDIYTTDSTGNKKDVALNQTAFNRVIDLVNGWNIFAPSQTLESSAVATVIVEGAGLVSGTDYDAFYTLTWDTDTSRMKWTTATTIDPLYGYAIHNISGVTKELPLDFEKEELSNVTFSRDLTNKGWYLIGYTGTTDSLVAQTSCLGGLTTGGYEEFSSIVDLTGTTVGRVPTSHLISSSATSELASAAPSTMLFAKDYAYAVFTTKTLLKLEGSRDR